MPSEPEVHFCNICNQSIPESALAAGSAVKIEGRILPLATPEVGTATPAASAAAGGSRFAMVSALLLVVVTIIAAAIYVDWRVAESEQRVRADVAIVAGPLATQAEQLDALDRRLASTLVAADLAPVSDDLADAREILRADVQALREGIDSRGETVAALRGAIEALEAAQVQEAARLALLQDEVRGLGTMLSEMAAALAEAPPAATPEPAAAAAAATPAEELPAELAEQVARLGASDDGVRFDAVDRLLQSKDPRVYAKLIPLAKDRDLFVRRLVLEGLAEHRSVESVDALIEALGDEIQIVRETAQAGLLRVTGEDIEFDAAASSDKRASMQRRWREWWERARDSF